MPIFSLIHLQGLRSCCSKTPTHNMVVFGWIAPPCRCMVSILWGNKSFSVAGVQCEGVCCAKSEGNCSAKTLKAASLTLCSFWKIWNGTDVINMCWCTQVTPGDTETLPSGLNIFQQWVNNDEWSRRQNWPLFYTLVYRKTFQVVNVQLDKYQFFNYSQALLMLKRWFRRTL